VNVLFVCVRNAGRSQMAAALFSRAADGRHVARSAGSEPAQHPQAEVVSVLAEVGIDIAGRAPRKLEVEDAEWADVAVSMGCGDACPVVPGTRYVDWELDDPHGKGLDEVRRIRDEIDARVRALVAQLDGSGE